MGTHEMTPFCNLSHRILCQLDNREELLVLADNDFLRVFINLKISGASVRWYMVGDCSSAGVGAEGSKV